MTRPSSDGAQQGGLIDDAPQLDGIVLIQQRLARHPDLDPALHLARVDVRVEPPPIMLRAYSSVCSKAGTHIASYARIARGRRLEADAGAGAGPTRTGATTRAAGYPGPRSANRLVSASLTR